MGLYAEVADVAARFEGEIPASRRDWIATLLEDAEQVLYAEIPSLDSRVADGRTSAAMVRRVLCSMVLAVIRNPSGYSSQTAGEFSYSFQGAGGTGANPGGRLALSAADRRALLGSRRAMTVPMHDPAVRHPLRRPVLRPAPEPASRPLPGEQGEG